MPRDDETPSRNTPCLPGLDRRNFLTRAGGLTLAAAGAAGAGSLLPSGTAHAAEIITRPQNGMQGGYYYHFWTDGVGTVSMTLGDAGHYTVLWNDCGNFVAGKGWATGGRRTVKWAGDFAPSGNGYLSVYGWTTNPLVEYCVMDGYGSYRPAFSDHRGVVASDGETYDIYRTVRVPLPSDGVGNQLIQQFWSINQGKRSTGGTITTGNHYDAWSRAGMALGGFTDFMIVSTEGYQSGGRADIWVE